jgi:hypothetical protein
VYAFSQCKERAKHASGAPSLEDLVLTSLRVGFSTVPVFCELKRVKLMEAVNLALKVRPRCACIMGRTRQKTKERVENKIYSGATKELGPCDVTRGYQNLS